QWPAPPQAPAPQAGPPYSPPPFPGPYAGQPQPGPAASWPAPPVPRPGGRGRQVWISVGVAVAVVAAVAVGVVVAKDGDDSGSKKAGPSAGVPGGGLPGVDGAPKTGGKGAASGGLVKPAHASGADGTTVVVGRPESGHVLDVYEDMRCPACAKFEQNLADTIRGDVRDGSYQVRFTMGTFLDKNLGGTGSKNALSALGAALDVSTDAFLDYKAALYSAAHHPSEDTDSFADDAYLLKVAAQVPALKGNGAFEAAVTGGTYDTWAQAMSDAFDASAVGGTPTVKLDGSPVTTDGSSPPLTPAEFDQAVSPRLPRR
ncbi:thioredoxin domain-containing protein, partial [Streptomyces sp. B1866]|uniref:thioredoxin domain-containing protein n=1 Tax=Streptomyces sp. B1866 TaxID=3075431 RepID=UPI00288F9237